MNFNDDEIVGLLNRLLEMLHQADGNNQGSIVFNVYSSGSLHVDHVDTQNFYGDACPKPQKEKEKGKEDTPTLPAPLGTEQAMVLWQKAQDAGYVDANYQPLISRTGRCDSGAAGHQGEVEGVRGAVEQEVYAE